MHNKKTVNKPSWMAIETSVSMKTSPGISSRVVTCPNENPVTPQNVLPAPKGQFFTSSTTQFQGAYFCNTKENSVGDGNFLQKASASTIAVLPNESKGTNE